MGVERWPIWGWRRGLSSVGVSGPRAAALPAVPLVVTLLSFVSQQPVLGLVPVGAVGGARVAMVRRVHVPVCARVAGGGVFILLFLLLLATPGGGAPPLASRQGVAGLIRWHETVLLQGGVGLFTHLLLLVSLQVHHLMRL